MTGASVVITGASTGIGRACALRFLDAGWRVALLARREERLRDLSAGHPDALAIACDVSDPDAVADAFARVLSWAGRVDVLFNNAGVFTPAASIDEVPLEDWLTSVSVNLNGMFFCARAAYAAMRNQQPQGGRIINNGSISAHTPRPGSVCYTTSKHAITGLTKSLALDGRSHNIACGQIDIGNARTELLEGHVARLRAADPTAEVPPMIDVDLVADAVLRMAELPLSANVLFQTLMATTMPYVGRG